MLFRSLDTRGIGGGIIAPGNRLPDGRSYKLIDTADLPALRGAASITLHDAPSAPRGLLYLASINAKERALISMNPALRDMIREAEPHEWTEILDRWREAEAAKIRDRIGTCTDVTGYRAQALNDLQRAASTFAALTDGRRTGLYLAACRVTKYAHHGYLSEEEIRSAFCDAARANGALSKYSAAWVAKTIRSALDCARNDALPPLAREFHTTVGRS